MNNPKTASPLPWEKYLTPRPPARAPGPAPDVLIRCEDLELWIVTSRARCADLIEAGCYVLLWSEVHAIGRRNRRPDSEELRAIVQARLFLGASLI